MNRGGRPMNSVWQYYYKVNKDGKQNAKCKNCGSTRSIHVDRMKNHLLQCLKKESGDEKPENFTAETSQPELKKCKMDSFVVQTSTIVAQNIDLLVAKFFYANNIPFSVVEHSTFLNLISALRPGYCPPNRKTLGNSLLDAVVAEVEGATKEKLAGKDVTLIEDGWSNLHNDPVIATCIHTAGKSYFLDAVDSGSNIKNAEYHKKVIQEAIQKAKEKYDCEVKAVVTDNAKVMERARQLLHDSNTNVEVYGCSSHWLNLLGEQVTPDSIMKRVIKVQKYFRNHHLPAGWLKEFPKSLKPQLPGQTRWNSQLTCIKTFIHNREFFQKIVVDHENEIDKDIVRLITDYNLFKQCKDLELQLKPIAFGLDDLQTDTATIADACHVWLKLTKENTLLPHITIVQKRLDQALGPMHFLAYLLHPKYMGGGLNYTQMETAHAFASAKIADCLPLLIAYEAQETPFPASYFGASAKQANPVAWWKGLLKFESFQQNNVALKLAELSIMLLSQPASSASIERIFSNFGIVHCKLRNRLGTEKCSKLVMCYRMLRGSSEPEF